MVTTVEQPATGRRPRRFHPERRAEQTRPAVGQVSPDHRSRLETDNPRRSPRILGPLAAGPAVPPAERGADRARAGSARAQAATAPTGPPGEPRAMARTPGRPSAGVGSRQEARQAPAAQRSRISTTRAAVGTGSGAKDGPHCRAVEQSRELPSGADHLAPVPTTPTHRAGAGVRGRQGRTAKTDRPAGRALDSLGTPNSPDEPAGRTRPRTARGALRRHSGCAVRSGAPTAEAQQAVGLVRGTGRRAVPLPLRSGSCRMDGDHERAPSFVEEARNRDLLTLHDHWCAQMSCSRRLPPGAQARGRTWPRTVRAESAGFARCLDLVTGARKAPAAAVDPVRPQGCRMVCTVSSFPLWKPPGGGTLRTTRHQNGPRRVPSAAGGVTP